MVGLFKSIGSFFTKAFPFVTKFGIEIFVLTTATLLVIAAFLLYQNKREEPSFIITPINSTSERKTAPNLMVQLAGAVTSAGVFEITSGARLKDVLGLAGGLSKNADKSYFEKNFNLARILRDQEKIYIPTREEVLSGINIIDSEKSEDAVFANTFKKVNLNSATISEIDSLPGIGPVTAQAIVKNRPYRGTADLQSKKVIATSTLQKIMDRIEF